MKTLHDTDQETLADNAATAFYDIIEQLLDEGTVVVSLCGGSSVKPFYQAIPRQAERLTRDQWSNVHFVWTDERVVPLTDDQSNYKMADSLFLRDLGKMRLLLEKNVHTFYGGTDNPEEEIKAYTQKLTELSQNTIHIPLLGVGKDGHVASLFPGHDTVTSNEKRYLLENDAPKPPKERVTISPRHITEATHPFIFFTQERKRDAYETFLDDTTSVENCPAKLAKQADPIVVTTLQT